MSLSLTIVNTYLLNIIGDLDSLKLNIFVHDLATAQRRKNDGLEAKTSKLNIKIETLKLNWKKSQR